jgi:hypothetical protein
VGVIVSITVGVPVNSVVGELVKSLAGSFLKLRQLLTKTKIGRIRVIVFLNFNITSSYG